MVGNLVYSILPMFVVAVLMGVFWSGATLELSIRAIRRFRQAKDLAKRTHKVRKNSDKFDKLTRHNSYAELIDESKLEPGSCVLDLFGYSA